MITSRQIVRIGNTTTCRVVSSSSPPVYFGWFVDGRFVGSGQSNQRSFRAGQNEALHIEVVDSTDPDYDFEANSPSGNDHPATRTVEWLRFTGGDVATYAVEMQENAGAWQTIATVPHSPKVWRYRVTTPRITNLADLVVRVTPYNAAGNAGTPTTLLTETVVRKPDPVNFTITYTGGGANSVTFAAGS